MSAIRFQPPFPDRTDPRNAWARDAYDRTKATGICHVFGRKGGQFCVWPECQPDGLEEVLYRSPLPAFAIEPATISDTYLTLPGNALHHLALLEWDDRVQVAWDAGTREVVVRRAAAGEAGLLVAFSSANRRRRVSVRRLRNRNGFSHNASGTTLRERFAGGDYRVHVPMSVQ